MGFDFQPENEKNNYYSETFPAIDSDGYVEDWWKRAVDERDSRE